MGNLRCHLCSPLCHGGYDAFLLVAQSALGGESGWKVLELACEACKVCFQLHNLCFQVGLVILEASNLLQKKLFVFEQTVSLQLNLLVIVNLVVLVSDVILLLCDQIFLVVALTGYHFDLSVGTLQFSLKTNDVTFKFLYVALEIVVRRQQWVVACREHIVLLFSLIQVVKECCPFGFECFNLALQVSDELASTGIRWSESLMRLLKFFPKFTGVLVVLGFHTADGVLEFVEQALVLTLKFGYQVSLAAVILPEMRYFSFLIIYPLI